MVAKYKYEEWQNAVLRFNLQNQKNKPIVPPWKRIMKPIKSLTVDDIDLNQIPPSFEAPQVITPLSPQPKHQVQQPLPFLPAACKTKRGTSS